MYLLLYIPFSSSSLTLLLKNQLYYVNNKQSEVLSSLPLPLSPLTFLPLLFADLVVCVCVFVQGT